MHWSFSRKKCDRSILLMRLLCRLICCRSRKWRTAAWTAWWMRVWRFKCIQPFLFVVWCRCRSIWMAGRRESKRESRFWKREIAEARFDVENGCCSMAEECREEPSTYKFQSDELKFLHLSSICYASCTKYIQIHPQWRFEARSGQWRPDLP